MIVRSRLVVPAVLAVTLLGGCGSGSDFTSKAEKVCSDGHALLLAANPVPGDAGLRAQAAAFDGMAAGLRPLAAPSGKKAEVDRLIADLEAAAAAQRAAAATNDHAKLVVDLAAERTAFAGVRADGAAAGLSTCAAQVTSG